MRLNDEVIIDGLPSTISVYRPGLRPLPARPIVFASPVSGSDPAGVYTAGVATAVVSDPAAVPVNVVPTQPNVTAGDPSASRNVFPPSLAALPESLKLTLLAVVLFLIWKWAK